MFNDEIVPVEISRGKGAPVVVSQDEHPRPDASADKLAALKPAFTAGGSVTAGNASGINDGASALLLVGGDAVAGQMPLARIVTSAVAGVDPSVMGIGPVPAVRKALKRAGLTVDQIDLSELNEAFAVAVDRVHPRSAAGSGEGEHLRRRDRARPRARLVGLAHDGDTRPRAAAPQGALRPGDDVHRRRSGHRGRRRTAVVSER